MTADFQKVARDGRINALRQLEAKKAQRSMSYLYNTHGKVVMFHSNRLTQELVAA